MTVDREQRVNTLQQGPGVTVTAAADRRLTARWLWLEIHSYLALVLGAFIALLGLTGALLAFHPQLDRLVSPELRAARTAVTPPDLDALVATATRRFGTPPSLLRMPRDGEPVYVAESYDAASGQYRFASIDAATGRIVSDRVWGRTLVTLLFDLHTGNVLGDAGFTFAGWLAVALLVSVATGVYLWWPAGGAWRRAFSFHWSRRAQALNLELHRLSGAYLALVLLVIAASGVYIVFPGPVSRIIGLFSPVTAEPDQVTATALPAAGTVRLTLREVLARVEALAPGARIVSIVLPEERSAAYAIRYVERGEPDSRYGQSNIWLDQHSGEVLEWQPYSRMNRAERLLALQLPLHSGDLFGTPGRFTALVAGVATVGMYGTGLYLWWKRRRRRRAC